MRFVNNNNKNSNSNNSNSNNNNNSNKQKKRKSVRFHKDVVVLQSIASSSPHAAWLSHYDYQSILKDVLEILKPKDPRTTENSPGCCTRGLESYSTTTTTTTTRIEDGLSNKADVILRRRDRIRVVVEEQQLQRREAAAGGQEGKPRCYNDFKMRDACLTHSNRLNGLRAVETSLRDSEAALAIYTGEE